MTKLMKKEKTKAITQFYPDYDYEKTQEENIKEEDRIASPKIKSNSNKVCSLILLGLRLIKINNVSANFNNPRPSLILNN